MCNFFEGKKLAFVYNVRHKYPDPGDPRTFNEADFDDQETINSIIKHLRNVGFTVLPIESDTKAQEIFTKEKPCIGFVLNYSEEILGSKPKIYMAQVLEKIGLPFSGCSNKTQRLIIDKGKMKKALLSKKVSTLPFQVFKSPNEKLDKKLGFPLIVKPLARGSSEGISNKSIVKSSKELVKQVKFILDTFAEPALVESYIEGREFSVGMIGNPPKILPIIEPKHEKLPKGYYHIDSLEVKWHLEEKLGEDYFSCPAKVGHKLKTKIKKLCLGAWNTLKIRDFCRIDLRMDEFGNLYILDVNSPPGLIPPEISVTAYFPMAARAKGYNYEKLLLKIIEIASKRYNLSIS